ncbi:molybdenum cofactor guanylyltransferase [Gorillibacterium massiliense]|uniref:molybdenum cofactor guanylyltransferase n=1 Tax=Gorillibacterium massiliense TaxID=1280390 RepID=UPI0004AE7B66|nr:molybdenum cofactor guanylyltransferase [Gorillibacterium massiliense]
MLTGVILAGGQGRKADRSSKSLLPFCGEILIQRQVRIMKTICREVIIVTNEPKIYLPVLGNSVRIITDYIPEKGPLGGMHAALSLGTSDYYWIVGSDMPFISAQAAQLMLNHMEEDSDAILPCFMEEQHPFHGIYRKRCLESVTTLLNKGWFDLNGLLREARVQEVNESFFRQGNIASHFVTNISTTEKYQQAMQLNYSLESGNLFAL